MQLEELRYQLGAVWASEQHADKHRVACSHHVEQMTLYVQGAVDRGETEGYLAHVRSLLAESDTRLVEAVATVSEFTDQREILEGRLNDLVAVAAEQ